MARYSGFYALFVVAVVIALVVSRSFDENGHFTVGRTHTNAPAVLTTADGTREMMIRATPGGSFLTEAVVDGAQVPVLIDTGASFFTLRESDAGRAGIYVGPQDFVHEFSTANGIVRAAQAEARYVELGPGRVDRVTVFILPDDKLDISLLGMNVLRRFGNVSFGQDQLTIAVD